MSLVSRFYQQEEGLRQRVMEIAADSQARALDVGCHTGDIARALARRVRSLTALDRRPHGDWHRNGAGVDFVAGDATALPFPDGVFDVLVSSECLQYVSNPEAALDEFRRVLRPGGRAVLTFPVGGLPGTWLDPENLVGVLERLLGRPHAALVALHPASRLLRHVGTGWKCERLLRRGSLAFIYIAFAIDVVQGWRMRLRRPEGGSRHPADAALVLILKLLFLAMRLDAHLPLGRLSYNNIVELRRLPDTVSGPAARACHRDRRRLRDS